MGSVANLGLCLVLLLWDVLLCLSIRRSSSGNVLFSIHIGGVENLLYVLGMTGFLIEVLRSYSRRVILDLTHSGKGVEIRLGIRLQTLIHHERLHSSLVLVLQLAGVNDKIILFLRFV